MRRRSCSSWAKMSMKGNGLRPWPRAPSSMWPTCWLLTQRFTASNLLPLLHDFVGDAELAVELEGAGVDDEGAGGGARFGGLCR